MNRTEQQFFALLRAGLWGDAVDAALFDNVGSLSRQNLGVTLDVADPSLRFGMTSGSGQQETDFSCENLEHSDTNWDAILEQCERQTVLGLVAKGISTLPINLQPKSVLLNKIRNRLASHIRTHAMLNRALDEVIAMLRENGINTVLLKGQGVATNYIEPTMRQCGDIDLYIGPQNYDRACELARQCYGTDINATYSDKHYHFYYGKITIELHRIAERLPLPWFDRRFQRFSVQHLQGEKLRIVQIGDTQINLPPINFDALYIFNHAWNHFSAGTGIGLRQLCDWVRYLHTFDDQIDRQELKKNLNDFGIWSVWRAFGWIAVNRLGLPKEKFPFYCDSYEKKGRKILKMIDKEGNFGFFDSSRTKHPKGYIAGKIHTLKKMHKRFIVVLTVFPIQTSAAWGKYIYDAVKRLVSENFRAKK